MMTVDVSRGYGVTGAELAWHLYSLAEKDGDITREMLRCAVGDSQPFSQENVVALALRLAAEGAPISHWTRSHASEGGVFKLEAHCGVSRARVEHAQCRAYSTYGSCFRGSHCLFGHVEPVGRRRVASDAKRVDNRDKS